MMKLDSLHSAFAATVVHPSDLSFGMMHAQGFEACSTPRLDIIPSPNVVLHHFSLSTRDGRWINLFDSVRVVQ